MLVLLSVGSAVNQQSVSCAVSEGGQRQTGDVVVVADGAARSGLINLLGQGRRGQGSRVTFSHRALYHCSSTEKSSSNQLISVQQQHNITF